MAPCTMERTERIGQVEVSQYRTWAAFGGGFEVVARNGSEVERIHTRSLSMADETFAMLVGKYSGHDTAMTTIDDYADLRDTQACAF